MRTYLVRALENAGYEVDSVDRGTLALPLLVPIVQAFAWSFVWFGVVMAILVAMGQFTPPVAVNLMVTAKIANAPLESTFRWVGWLLLGMIVALGLVVIFPELALWLPRVLGYRIN